MDGIIIIDKEKNCTSHDVVKKVKKLLNEKVGHTGTLDPNATGVLPILVGQGTKVSKYLINHDKAYEAVLKLGEKRDTADIEGNVIEKREVNKEVFNKSVIEQTLKQFIGKQKQIPPMYSAIKINGKKLYEYARIGQNVEIEPRDIEIYDINLVNIDEENKEITIQVKCSKGTYIRTLCEEIAEKLNTVGYMKELKRLQVGEFYLKDAIKIEEFEENLNHKEFMDKHFITIENYFSKYPELMLEDKKISLLLNGVQLTCKQKDGIYRIYNQSHQFIGLAILKEELLKREIMI